MGRPVHGLVGAWRVGADDHDVIVDDGTELHHHDGRCDLVDDDGINHDDRRRRQHDDDQPVQRDDHDRIHHDIDNGSGFDHDDRSAVDDDEHDVEHRAVDNHVDEHHVDNHDVDEHVDVHVDDLHNRSGRGCRADGRDDAMRDGDARRVGQRRRRQLLTCGDGDDRSVRFADGASPHGRRDRAGVRGRGRTGRARPARPAGGPGAPRAHAAALARRAVAASR